jgi:hypothetical protein
VRDLYEPQELEVFLHSEETEHETTKMVGIDKRTTIVNQLPLGEGQRSGRRAQQEVNSRVIGTRISQPQLIMELERLELEVVEEGTPALLCSMTMQPDLLERIKVSQVDDPKCQRIKKQLEEGKASEFCVRDDGMLTHFKQVCVPGSNE